MPFVYDPNLDSEEDQKDPSQVQISGAAPTVNSGTSNGQKQGPAATQNTGSGFQNLDKYLQGNQGQDLGNQVAGKIQTQVDQAKTNIDSASGAYTDKVKSSNSLPNQEQVNSAIANPTSNDSTQFQKWENQAYTGPRSLAEDQEDYNKFWSGTNQANTQAQLLGTEPGRFSLLDSYFGKPTYNFGQKSLDNLLIQQGKGIGESTKNLQDQAAQLKTYGNDQTKALQNVASTQAGAVDQNRQMVRNAIGIDDQGSVVTDPNAQGYGALGKQYQSMNDATTQANSDRTNQFKQLQADISSGRVTDDELKKLGLTANQTIYDLNPNNYLTQNAGLTQDQVMTPEQRSYIQALSQMAGVTDTFAQGTGQAATDPYTFDTARFQNDVQGRAAGYTNELNSTFNAIKNSAPLAPSDLDAIAPGANPSDVMRSLNQQKQMWLQQQAGGNPMAAERLNRLDQSINALGGVLTKYGVDTDSGLSRYLQAGDPFNVVYGHGPQVRPE